MGQLIPNSDICLQLSLTSPASSSFLSPKIHLKVGPDGEVTLPNTMDVLTCMEGEKRFYLNGPIASDLEYTVTVEGVGDGILRRQVYGEKVKRVDVGVVGNPGEMKGVRKVEVGGGGKVGEVQGTLFLPEVPGPGVLCLSGAGGVRVSFHNTEKQKCVMLKICCLSRPGRHCSIFGWQRLYHSCSCLFWTSRPSQVKNAVLFLRSISPKLQELCQSSIGVL